uniref:Immunoglobulin V-set domain-containing protein n=1 Tax=Anopheles melas TaxID=34690 RepID=A0A182U4S8_9DIPT
MNTSNYSPINGVVLRNQNQISWIRRRDWHILSSGAQMYTNDERFAILHTPGSNTWTLQIKFVQRRDHGTYECQPPLTRKLRCGENLPKSFHVGKMSCRTGMPFSHPAEK